ncbi:MAG: hypothetical protein A2492_07345 [Ignavibacteria bacterium RIFOXYC12_FULL_35_11]|nr:MAG: hypothetical protein A2492_07345 [Ignavibacteria bacterium RIFOXYC12_FULL_35_11]
MKNRSIYILIFALCFLAEYLFPQQSKLSKSVNNISEFIASGEFLILKEQVGGLSIVDSIYSQALKVNDNDHSEALLSLIFATVPYNEVPVQIPIIKSILNFPLIAASDSIFKLKNANLPGYIFFDSPMNNYGDKDKLAHFFGSAFLSYSSNYFDLGNAIGYLVEVFEESFKVQSSIDERDLITNKLGNLFGTVLKQNKNILPSQIIILRTLSNFSYSL